MHPSKISHITGLMADKCPPHSPSMLTNAAAELGDQKRCCCFSSTRAAGISNPQQQQHPKLLPQPLLVCSSSSSSASKQQQQCQHSRPLPDEYKQFQTLLSTPKVRQQHPVEQQQELPQTGDPNRMVEQDAPSPSPLSTRRYFDALQGPELDVLKDSEDVFLLPLDQKWPFLLRFPINCFGIVLGLGSQAILWKTMASSPCLSFLHVPKEVNLVLWCAALLALIAILTTYLLKCAFFFEAVRREYFHPVRVNYFFAPWIGSMFLAIGVPDAVATTVNPAVWCVFMAPLLALELKIYGQWLSGGDRRLSRVANPSTHLSVVGNFVGAVLSAKVGWKEAGLFFWCVGLAHYVVVFVTCYQRLPTNNALAKELHPVFFLFVAAPCTASVAWEGITGSFDRVSRFVYFVALFLLLSLVVRVNLFRGIRFSTSWWAYTFPLGAAAVASIHYCENATHPLTQVVAVALSLVASVVVFTIFVLTVFHACVWGTLFPNDLAIAITEQKNHRPKTRPSFLKNRIFDALQQRKGLSSSDEESQVPSAA